MPDYSFSTLLVYPEFTAGHYGNLQFCQDGCHSRHHIQRQVEFGIGAGVIEAEHAAYGTSFPQPSVKIDRVEEDMEIIRRIWTKEKASYSGKITK